MTKAERIARTCCWRPTMTTQTEDCPGTKSEHKTASEAAKWWRERYTGINPDGFQEALDQLVSAELGERRYVYLDCDCDPAGLLLDAVRAAGQECSGFMFSARGILPEKTRMTVQIGYIRAREGYGAPFQTWEVK